MTPRQHLERLDLAAVLRPFAAFEGELGAAIEDLDGRVLAAIPDPSLTRVAPGARVDGVIQVHGEVAGRVVLHGPGADEPLARAAAEALGRALSAALASPIDAPDVPVPAHIEQELAHGRRLQRSFVSLVPPDVPGYELASFYEAAREVGGDFFDLFRLRRRGRPLSLVIADVTGKGIAAALLMAFSRPLLHAAIDHADGPAQALIRTNAILVGERRTGLFLTALVARLDVRSGVLRFANAGHEPPIFVPGDDLPATLVLGSGPLIGAFQPLPVGECEVVLRPGDAMVFYTDGVTDARSPSGERFEEERLFAAIESVRGGSADDLVRAIGDAVTTFQGGAEAADDITLVVLGRSR